MVQLQFTFPEEIWHPIPGWKGWYEASNLGSIKRIKAASGTRVGLIQKPQPCGNGYYHIKLHRNGKRTILTLHRVIARTFLGPCPKGFEINHINGIKSDNRAENLEYVTPSQNHRHAHTLGLKKTLRGEDANWAKLTEYEVKQIRHFTAIGMSQREISKIFNISPGTIGDIYRKKSWRHIT